MWGIIPAAGSGTRIQPLAFSKELLPVGSRREDGTERPRAVSEYLVDRMLAGGADKLCFVISPGKWDILRYYGADIGGASIAYVVQPRPAGLCDAIFRAVPLVDPSEDVVIGLPDTIWFPEEGLRALDRDVLSFLLFPVDRPELFDAVATDPQGRVREIWRSREPRDEYLGTLINAYLAQGGEARGVRAGTAYVDVGTLHGYRAALELLQTCPQDNWRLSSDQLLANTAEPTSRIANSR